MVSRYHLTVLSRDDIGRLSAMTGCGAVPAIAWRTARKGNRPGAGMLQKLFIHLTEPSVGSFERQVS
jgi:hypothetical protein